MLIIRLKNRDVLGEAQKPRLVYHTGPKLTGDSLSLDYLRTGEGGNMLGPGIYFSTDKEESLQYAGYHKEPIIYTMKLTQPEKIVSARKKLFDGRDWKTFAEGTDLKEAIQKAKDMGIAGVVKRDEYGTEYCIFDFSVLEFVDMRSAKGPGHDKLYVRMKFEQERENNKCPKCYEELWDRMDYHLDDKAMQQIRAEHNEDFHPTRSVEFIRNFKNNKCKACKYVFWEPSDFRDITEEDMNNVRLDHEKTCPERRMANADKGERESYLEK